MLVTIAVPILVLSLLLVVVMHRILMSAPWARDIDQIIPYVTSVDEFLRAFDEVMLTKIHHLTSCRLHWRDKRIETLETLRQVLWFLGRFDDNAMLFGALARYEMRMMLDRPTTYGGHGQTVNRLLRRSWRCRGIVVYARAQTRFLIALNSTAWFLIPYKVYPGIGSMWQRALQEYLELRALALSLASHHGEHYYDNLLSAL
jgi:hypothetical protein